jgi:hypothetical protein
VTSYLPKNNLENVEYDRWKPQFRDMASLIDMRDNILQLLNYNYTFVELVAWLFVWSVHFYLGTGEIKTDTILYSLCIILYSGFDVKFRPLTTSAIAATVLQILNFPVQEHLTDF